MTEHFAQSNANVRGRIFPARSGRVTVPKKNDSAVTNRGCGVLPVNQPKTINFTGKIMKTKRNATLLLMGLVLNLSGMVSAQSHGQVQWVDNVGTSQTLHVSPMHTIYIEGTPTNAPTQYSIPSQDFLRGKLRGDGTIQPVPRDQWTTGIPQRQLAAPQQTHGGYPPLRGRAGAPLAIPRTLPNPGRSGNGPYSTNLLHHTQRQTFTDGYYNDGRGGTARGNIGLIGEANADLGADPSFAGVRGHVRGGMGAQGNVQQVYDINGMPMRNYVEGEAFLGTEAEARAGLSPEGLGGSVGGFSGLRARAKNGVDLGVVDVGTTVEGRIGFGADANANIGLQDGKFRLKGELGAALGVGGKLGVETEVDLGQTGRTIERVGGGAIKGVGNAAKDVDRWATKANKDVNRTVKNVGKDIGKGFKKIGGLFGK